MQLTEVSLFFVQLKCSLNTKTTLDYHIILGGEKGNFDLKSSVFILFCFWNIIPDLFWRKNSMLGTKLLKFLNLFSKRLSYSEKLFLLNSFSFGCYLSNSLREYIISFYFQHTLNTYITPTPIILRGAH